jgi:hypothetical protein
MGNKLNHKKGTITCYGCKTEIGGWKWSGWSCKHCKLSETPSFYIYLNKITYIDLPSSPSISKNNNNNNNSNFPEVKILVHPD